MNQMMIKVSKSFNIKMCSQINVRNLKNACSKLLMPNFVILLKEELHRETTNRK